MGELVYATERGRGIDEAMNRHSDLRRLPIRRCAVTEERVLAAAHIKANYAVSYADAFAIALARELNAIIVTGDPEFQSVEKIVDILWLHEPTPQEKAARGKEAHESRAMYRVKAKRKRRSPSTK